MQGYLTENDFKEALREYFELGYDKVAEEVLQLVVDGLAFPNIMNETIRKIFPKYFCWVCQRLHDDPHCSQEVCL